MVFHHKNYTLFFRVTMQGEVVCLTFLENITAVCTRCLTNRIPVPFKVFMILKYLLAVPLLASTHSVNLPVPMLYLLAT